MAVPAVQGRRTRAICSQRPALLFVECSAVMPGVAAAHVLLPHAQGLRWCIAGSMKAWRYGPQAQGQHCKTSDLALRSVQVTKEGMAGATRADRRPPSIHPDVLFSARQQQREPCIRHVFLEQAKRSCWKP